MEVAIVGFVSIIGIIASIIFLIVSAVKKKSKKIGVIGLILSLGLFIITMTQDVDTTNITENVTKPVSNDESKTGSLEDYTKDIKEPLDSYFDGYDVLLGEWEETFNSLGDGQINSLDAYNNVKKLNEGFSELWKMNENLEAPNYFKDEDKENFKNTKDNLSMAIVQWQQATKKAMKMLDKNDFSNSRMSEIQELTGKAQEYLVPAVSSKLLLDSSFGIEVEQQ